jgi:DNA-binding Lrp family transcriptional regulator
MKNNKSAKHNKVYDNSNKINENIDVLSQLDNYSLPIDTLDQKLLELLVLGYENKKIATEVKTPLSTIQRRIRRIFENQYISRRNELNYKKLGFRKGFLQITLQGDKSHIVAQKLTALKGIISVSEVTGNFDILCVCVFRDTDELFNLLENIKTTERIGKVAWVEEVRSLQMKETTSLVVGLQRLADKNILPEFYSNNVNNNNGLRGKSAI